MDTQEEKQGNASSGIERIEAAWAADAESLAPWAKEKLVNRDDCWGTYDQDPVPEGEKRRAWTAYATQQPDQQGITQQRLSRHFRGECIIGLHTTSLDQRSRWVAWDIDHHTLGAPGLPAQNFTAALALTAELHRRGFASILEDSNGQGGYHIWCCFDQPVPTAAAFHWAHQVMDAVHLTVETFPKQPSTKDQHGKYKLGNWLRLPGRHHSRPHWSRFYVEGQWLEGAAATAWLLHAPVNSASAVPAAPSIPPQRAKRHRTVPSQRHQTPRRPATLVERQQALDCLKQLARRRAEDYGSWLAVGMALHAVDIELLDAWDAWSQGSAKYHEGVCAQKWRRFTGSGLGLGSLMYWKQQDLKSQVAPERIKIGTPLPPGRRASSNDQTTSSFRLGGRAV
jgi:hypothetical protein